MTLRLATSNEETPAFFPAGEDKLFGILTRPTGESNGVGVILVYGGTYNMSANRNQLWLSLARRIAARGFHTFRYDYHGLGDSTGRAGVFDHRSLYAEDLQAAIRWMEEQGFRRLILVGDCLGARASLVSHSHVESLEGIVLLVPLVHDGSKAAEERWAESYGLTHYLKRGFRWQTLKNLRNPTLRRGYVRVGRAKLTQVSKRGGRTARSSMAPGSTSTGYTDVSPRFTKPLSQVLDRGVPLDFVFGSRDSERRGEFDDARQGRLGEILGDAGPLVSISVVSGSLAGIPDLEAQVGVIDHIEGWITSGIVTL